MYMLLLIAAALFTMVSPVLLDLYLTAREFGFERRRSGFLAAKAKGPSIAWASPRLH